MLMEDGESKKGDVRRCVEERKNQMRPVSTEVNDDQAGLNRLSPMILIDRIACL